MKLRYLLFVLAIICISTISCSGGKEKNSSAVDSFISKATRFCSLDINFISVSILKDGGESVTLSKEDANKILAYLNSGVYNKERNDDGIKYKMMEPDYTFLIESEDGKKEMAQYWIESALILVDAKWYNPISAANIQDTLEKYSK